MPSPSLTYGGRMKILNTGTANFIVRDKRGNSVCLEPKHTVEVEEKVGRKVARVYSYIKIVEEKPIEVPKVEEKKDEEVVEKPKKAKRKKNVSTTD